MLLAEGRVIYFGPSRDVVNYFVTSPYHFNYRQGSNPADFVIAVAGSFLPSSEGKRVAGQELAAYYSSSDLCRVFLENIDTMIAMDLAAGATSSKDINAEEGSPHKEEESEYTTSTLNQIKVLCHRVVVKTIKNRRPVVVTFFRWASVC